MDNDRYYQLGSYDKLFNQIDELEAALGCRDNEIAELKKELYAISVAIDDPRTDLTMTMVEVITDQHKERDHLREQVTLLRGRLLASANYIDALGGNSFDPRRTLAATELHASS